MRDLSVAKNNKVYHPRLRATFSECYNRCEGLNYVILSGEVVVENAIYNGKKKGRFIFKDK